MPPTENRRWYVYRADRGPLGGTMEDVAEALQRLDGVLFEWDGSFSWANPAEGWHFHGNLYDDPVGLHYVDLHVRWTSRASSSAVRQAFATLLNIFQPDKTRPVDNRSTTTPKALDSKAPPDSAPAVPMARFQPADPPDLSLLQLPQRIWQVASEVQFGS